MSPRGRPKASVRLPGPSRMVLRRLADAGGAIDHMTLGKGHIPPNYFGVSTATVRRCQQEGWITRDVRGRKTLAIALTDKGRELIEADPGPKPRKRAPDWDNPQVTDVTRVVYGTSPAARARKAIAAKERIALAWEALGAPVTDVRHMIEFVELAREILDGETSS